MYVLCDRERPLAPACSVSARDEWERVPVMRRREIADFLREQAGAFADTLPMPDMDKRWVNPLWEAARSDIEKAAGLLDEEPLK